jgi:hypothetical protein
VARANRSIGTVSCRAQQQHNARQHLLLVATQYQMGQTTIKADSKRYWAVKFANNNCCTAVLAFNPTTHMLQKRLSKCAGGGLIVDLLLLKAAARVLGNRLAHPPTLSQAANIVELQWHTNWHTMPSGGIWCYRWWYTLYIRCATRLLDQGRCCTTNECRISYLLMSHVDPRFPCVTSAHNISRRLQGDPYCQHHGHTPTRTLLSP